MASRRMTKLTDRQRDAVLALRGNPGVWMTAKDLFNKMCEVSPWNSDSSHVGSLMRLLPQKDQRVEIDDSTSTTRYRWNGDADGSVECVGRMTRTARVDGDGFSMLPKSDRLGDSEWSVAPIVSMPPFAPNWKPGQLTDEKIVFDALMHYAQTMAQTDTLNAVRAAFLAGRGGFFGGGKGNGKAKQAVRLDSVTKAGASDFDNPTVGREESEDENRVAATMPPNMSYAEFVETAKAAYKNLEFTWEQGAKRAEMGIDYFMRVCRGDATPSRLTQERVYSAIFDA